MKKHRARYLTHFALAGEKFVPNDRNRTVALPRDATVICTS